eukprot:scaffold15425_cov62-Attheya_sp.AAC.5
MKEWFRDGRPKPCRINSAFVGKDGGLPLMLPDTGSQLSYSGDIWVALGVVFFEVGLTLVVVDWVSDVLAGSLKKTSRNDGTGRSGGARLYTRLLWIDPDGWLIDRGLHWVMLPLEGVLREGFLVSWEDEVYGRLPSHPANENDTWLANT